MLKVRSINKTKEKISLINTANKNSVGAVFHLASAA